MTTISPLQYFIGAGFTLTGIVVLIIGWRDFRRQHDLVRHSIRTTGTVVGVQLEGGTLDDPTVYQHPTIRFVTDTGTVTTFTSPFGRSESWKDGQRVPVRYHRDRPDQAELDSFVSIWLTTLVCAVLGTICLTSGMVLLLVPPEAPEDFEVCHNLPSDVQLQAGLFHRWRQPM